MLKNNNIIKKVKVLSYNETNKKFDAQSVILSNIADATDEFDAINFSCLKKYINNNVDYKINEIIENIKEIKRIIYNTDISKDKNVSLELNNEDFLNQIKKSIFEFNLKHKDMLNKFLHYEKKNEYILKDIEKLDNNFIELKKNVLDRNIYLDDKDSLKEIFFSLENKFNERINYMIAKYDEVNKLYSDISLVLNELRYSDYSELKLKVQNLDNIPQILDNINKSILECLEYKNENNLRIEKFLEQEKFKKKNIDELFEETKILKNILKELESKILLFDVDILKNKKDIEYLDQNFKTITNPNQDSNIEINEKIKQNINTLEKKILILEKLFNEEKQINTKEHLTHVDDKKKINDTIENVKILYDELYTNLENFKKECFNEIDTIKKKNIEEQNKYEENINILCSDNINSINELKKNISTIKEILDSTHELKKNDKNLFLINQIEELKKDNEFTKEKIQKFHDLKKIDFDLVNSTIEVIKEDIIKINKIILDNNSSMENFKETIKKINTVTCTNVKEFLYDIPIQNLNTNFTVPTNLNTHFSFSQKQHVNKFIESKLIKLYTKIEFKNNHNIIIPINPLYNKNNIIIKCIKNNKEIFKFTISDFNESSHEINEDIILDFPLNLSIKPNNLKECINLDYYVKRNSLKTINVKILGVFVNTFK